MMLDLILPHFHYVGDGRPPRRVTVDGQEVDRVVEADTRNGYVQRYGNPPRIVKGQLEVETLIGKVQVEYHTRWGQK